MEMFIYKWLPIFFGCHCRSDRSFYFRGKQFPICARCTGELVGFVLAAISYIFWHPHWIVLLMLMVPMIIDGTIQQCTSYESKNPLRFFTGLLFGYAFITLIILSLIYVFHLGQEAGATFWHKK